MKADEEIQTSESETAKEMPLSLKKIVKLPKKKNPKILNCGVCKRNFRSKKNYDVHKCNSKTKESEKSLLAEKSKRGSKFESQKNLKEVGEDVKEVGLKKSLRARKT